MSYANAKDTIVRKFTNYRANRKRLNDERNEIAEALKKCAAALFDAKSFSKGRLLFKRRMLNEINAKRDELLRESPNMSKVGAFQKAWKTLWSETNQDYWDSEAISEAEDVYL
jgi:hypothetical protein